MRRLLNSKKILSLFLAVTLLFTTIVPASGWAAEGKTSKQNENAKKSVSAEVYKQPDFADDEWKLDKRKDAQVTHRIKQKLIDRYGVTEAFIQGELNKGYTLPDLQKALWLTEKRSMSYDEAISRVKPKYVNR